MKKLLISTFVIITTSVLVLSSCSKKDFDDNYYNPEASVDANIPSLYAGLFVNARVSPHYWNLYTFLIPMMGTYSQTSGYTNGSHVYEQEVNYTKDRWNDYYTTTISRYREIQKYYDNLTTDDEKTGFQLFLETATVFVYDQTEQIIDMWGDIPFSTSGQLNLNGTITLASYDKSEGLYDSMLTDLKRISDYLATAAPAQFYFDQLKAYDFVNKGDILKWRKYCNSLRLRMAMRISYQDESAAKSVIQEILGNPSQYPVVDAAAESITIQPPSTTSSLVSVNDIRSGFGVNPFAPGKMVDTVMVPSGDLRLPVYFTANKNGEYRGVPLTWTATRVQDSITANYFSRYDSTTFTENNLFPGIIITAAEVSFIKAEAYERWGGGAAKDAYENGIRQSIEFYTAVNNNSDYTGGSKLPMPSEADIQTFLANPIVAYGTNNLEKIATQKWIDFNVMQANQAWAEWRRTKLPELYFATDPSSVIAPNVPNRLLYPTTEATLNEANYAAVKAEDNINSKVFWDVK